MRRTAVKGNQLNILLKKVEKEKRPLVGDYFTKLLAKLFFFHTFGTDESNKQLV